ncbi:DUF484 family protein [Rhodoferax sp. 4810]|uniref:DUF484 family protein n=1 Tax=Thiospirillum jenense TaxID=1653858 RepID=A0A839H5T9_9GAMM|nr:DUF484 family protein [Thiospirillum jenense]MBB1074189.1 DUF484 family protein [Rhodoferax jenense]MBB1125263.1 DUF484 family protein [Thiospirillum jenense]
MKRTVRGSTADREERLVLRYLERNPDVFERHPDMIANLRIPHGDQGTVSLVERQLTLLRDQLQQERQRLRDLIERAQEYERLHQHLHQLTVHLITACDLTQVYDVLEVELRREFHAEAVVVKLFPLASDGKNTPPPTAELSVLSSDAMTRSFSEFIQLGHCLCGTLDTEQYQTLFGDLGDQLNSAALIPLRGDGLNGVLAIGSRDANRFTADLATDVLARLGEIASAKLSEMIQLNETAAPVPAADVEHRPQQLELPHRN